MKQNIVILHVRARALKGACKDSEVFAKLIDICNKEFESCTLRRLFPANTESLLKLLEVRASCDKLLKFAKACRFLVCKVFALTSRLPSA